MPNTPLTWRPGAVATPIGWAHEVTGEHLVATRRLEPDAGTEGYLPNNPAWMRAFNAEGGGNEPFANVVNTYTTAVLAAQPTEDPDVTAELTGWMQGGLVDGPEEDVGAHLSGPGGIAVAMASLFTNSVDSSTHRTFAIAADFPEDVGPLWAVVSGADVEATPIPLTWGESAQRWGGFLDSRVDPYVPSPTAGATMTVVITASEPQPA